MRLAAVATPGSNCSNPKRTPLFHSVKDRPFLGSGRPTHGQTLVRQHGKAAPGLREIIPLTTCHGHHAQGLAYRTTRNSEGTTENQHTRPRPRFGPEALAALDEAAYKASVIAGPTVLPMHLCLALLYPLPQSASANPAVAAVLVTLEQNRLHQQHLRDALTHISQRQQEPLSPASLDSVLHDAERIATCAGSSEVRPEHLLAAVLAQGEESPGSLASALQLASPHSGAILQQMMMQCSSACPGFRAWVHCCKQSKAVHDLLWECATKLLAPSLGLRHGYTSRLDALRPLHHHLPSQPHRPCTSPTSPRAHHATADADESSEAGSGGAAEQAGGRPLQLLSDRLQSKGCYPPLNWRGLLQLMALAVVDRRVPSSWLATLMCDRISALCSVQPPATHEALALLVFTCLLGVPLPGDSLRRVVAPLDHTYAPMLQPRERAPFLAAFAWHASMLHHMDAQPQPAANNARGGASPAPASPNKGYGIVSQGGRKAWVEGVLGKSWLSGMANQGVAEQVKHLTYIVQALDVLSWPEVPSSLVGTSVSLNKLYELLIIGLYGGVEDPHLARTWPRAQQQGAAGGGGGGAGGVWTEPVSDDMPGSLIRTLVALLGWQTTAYDAYHFEVRGALDSLPSPLIWDVVLRATCVYLGWGGWPHGSQLGNVQEGVALLRVIASLQRASPQQEMPPVLLEKLVEHAGGQLSSSACTPQALADFSWSVCRLSGVDITDLLLSHPSVVQSLQWQAAGHAKNLSPAQLLDVLRVLCLARDPEGPAAGQALVPTWSAAGSDSTPDLRAALLPVILQHASRAAVVSFHVTDGLSETPDGLSGGGRAAGRAAEPTFAQVVHMVSMASQLGLLQAAGQPAAARQQLAAWLSTVQRACEVMSAAPSQGAAVHTSASGGVHSDVAPQAGTATGSDTSAVTDSLAATAQQLFAMMKAGLVAAAEAQPELPATPPAQQPRADARQPQKLKQRQRDGAQVKDSPAESKVPKVSADDSQRAPVPPPAPEQNHTALAGHVAASLARACGFDLATPDAAGLLDAFAVLAVADPGATPPDVTSLAQFQGPVSPTFRGLGLAMLCAAQQWSQLMDAHPDNATAASDEPTPAHQLALLEHKASLTAQLLMQMPCEAVARPVDTLAILWCAAVMRLSVDEAWQQRVLDMLQVPGGDGDDAGQLSNQLDPTHVRLMLWALPQLDQIVNVESLLQSCDARSRRWELLLELKSRDYNLARHGLSAVDQYLLHLLTTTTTATSPDTLVAAALPGLSLQDCAFTLWSMAESGARPSHEWLAAAGQHVAGSVMAVLSQGGGGGVVETRKQLEVCLASLLRMGICSRESLDSLWASAAAITRASKAGSG